MCCKSPRSVSGMFRRKPGEDGFVVVWFGFHKVIIRGTLKCPIYSFLQRKEERSLWNRQDKRGLLFEHPGVVLLCVVTVWGLDVV